MDGWLYEKINGIEQMLTFLVQKLQEAEKKSQPAQKAKPKPKRHQVEEDIPDMEEEFE